MSYNLRRIFSVAVAALVAALFAGCAKVDPTPDFVRADRLIQASTGLPTAGASGVEVAVAGFAFVGTMIRIGTTILLITPDVFRGRISGFQQLCFRVAQPLGALLAGLIAQHLSIRMSFGVFGLVVPVAVGAAALWRRMGRGHQNANE
jgi:hypothetical protein